MRPAQLDDKRYASYGARFEGRIVQQLIRNDGGRGEFIEDAAAEHTGIFEGLQRGAADATWVFMGWEGVMAEQQGVQLRAFPFEKFGVRPLACGCALVRLRGWRAPPGPQLRVCAFEHFGGRPLACGCALVGRCPAMVLGLCHAGGVWALAGGLTTRGYDQKTPIHTSFHHGFSRSPNDLPHAGHVWVLAGVDLSKGYAPRHRFALHFITDSTGIPNSMQVTYGYSPVLAAARHAIADPEHAARLRAFLAASSKGWSDLAAAPAAGAASVRALPIAGQGASSEHRAGLSDVLQHR